MSTQQMHVIFLGDVQGVGFRATTQHFALQLGLSGTVQNLSDGSVELYAHGAEEQLNKLLHLIHQNFGDSIRSSSPSFSDYDGPLEEFKILKT
jgi:acylphosphatase